MKNISVLDDTNSLLLRSNWGTTLEKAIEYFERHEKIEIYEKHLDSIKNEIERIKNPN